jgi:predicted aldo/keto reductase-like oxidoreductase
MKTNSRRSFIKKSALGIPGAILLPSYAKASISINSGSDNKTPLPVRPLGKTGISTPLISMGTSGVTATGFVRAAYEAGVRLFFSANYYGQGNNEILVGKGLKGLPRDSFVIGTASTPEGLERSTGTLPRGFKADNYIKTAEESLKRFGLDHIDILLLPYAGKKETILHEGVLKTFEHLKKQGKIRFAGIASHSDTIEALDAAAGSGIYDVAMIGYNYKIQDINALNQSVARAARAGMGIVAMKSTAGAARSRSGKPGNITAALKWVLKNENIASIVSGMTTFEELEQNMAMLKDLKISDKELDDLNLASAISPTGLYCQQCRKCIAQCPYNLEIPTIMRSYMYAYGYRNMEQAWYTLAEAGVTSDPCSNCSKCNVGCASRFDLKMKITDIARLKNVPYDFISS